MILISAVLFVLRQRFLRRSGRICGMRPGLARGAKRVGLSETEEGREAARLVSGRKGGRAVPVDLHSCGFSSLAVVERYAGRCPRGYGQQQPDRTVPAGARLTARLVIPHGPTGMRRDLASTHISSFRPRGGPCLAATWPPFPLTRGNIVGGPSGKRRFRRRCTSATVRMGSVSRPIPPRP